MGARVLRGDGMVTDDDDDDGVARMIDPHACWNRSFFPIPDGWRPMFPAVAYPTQGVLTMRPVFVRGGDQFPAVAYPIQDLLTM